MTLQPEASPAMPVMGSILNTVTLKVQTPWHLAGPQFPTREIVFSIPHQQAHPALQLATGQPYSPAIPVGLHKRGRRISDSLVSTLKYPGSWAPPSTGNTFKQKHQPSAFEGPEPDFLPSRCSPVGPSNL